jgi:uncharacterized protein
MWEKIQQVSRKKKSGQKASMGVVPIAEGTNFTRISDHDTSTTYCCTKAAGSRETIKKITTESGIIQRIFSYLNPKNLLIAVVELYRLCISPWFSPCCRFQPSCSSYAQEALHEHGLIKGLSLSFWRIIRCHPFCKGGHDPVPPKKEPCTSQLHNIRGLK